jgi:hypothetical protein
MSRVARVNALQIELTVIAREMEITRDWLLENMDHDDADQVFDEFMTMEFTASVLSDLVAINMSTEAIEPTR